jgi:hypothetical protein
MNKLLLTIPLCAGALLLSSCHDDDDYDGHYVSGGVYGGGVDFYYSDVHPYSRAYGPLYLRDGRYYYSRGGGYVLYDRPTYAYSERNRYVNREVNVSNQKYVNRRVVKKDSDRDRDVVVRSSQPNVRRVSSDGPEVKKTSVRKVQKTKKEIEEEEEQKRDRRKRA